MVESSKKNTSRNVKFKPDPLKLGLFDVRWSHFGSCHFEVDQNFRGIFRTFKCAWNENTSLWFDSDKSGSTKNATEKRKSTLSSSKACFFFCVGALSFQFQGGYFLRTKLATWLNTWICLSTMLRKRFQKILTQMVIYWWCALVQSVKDNQKTNPIEKDGPRKLWTPGDCLAGVPSLHPIALTDLTSAKRKRVLCRPHALVCVWKRHTHIYTNPYESNPDLIPPDFQHGFSWGQVDGPFTKVTLNSPQRKGP